MSYKIKISFSFEYFTFSFWCNVNIISVPYNAPENITMENLKNDFWMLKWNEWILGEMSYGQFIYYRHSFKFLKIWDIYSYLSILFDLSWTHKMNTYLLNNYTYLACKVSCYSAQYESVPSINREPILSFYNVTFKLIKHSLFCFRQRIVRVTSFIVVTRDRGLIL